MVRKLDQVQNQAMRIITGAVNSIPTSALLYHINETNIESEIIESALKLHEKLICLFNIDYPSSNPNINPRLKTQEEFL